MAVESKPIELGIEAAPFSLPGVDGRTYNLDSFRASKLLVIGFTCNHCPYVQAYEDRLNALARKFQPKSVAFVCINPNDSTAYPEDSYEEMKKRAAAKDFAFVYLRDESQAVARAYNAACTPEFYIFDSERKLRYHGRLDDNHKDPRLVKQFYMRDALEALLQDQSPAITQTAAMGCSIKWKN